MNNEEKANEIIKLSIEKMRASKSTFGKLTSWTGSTIRGAVGTTSTIKNVDVGGSVLLKVVSIGIGIIPIIGPAAGKLSDILSDIGKQKMLNNQLQKGVLANGIWANVIPDVAALQIDMQRMTNSTMNDIFPKMNDALYKLYSARIAFNKAVEEGLKEGQKKLDKNKIKSKDNLKIMKKITDSYGYYLHRKQRLRFYMDAMQAFMLQYEEGYEILDQDVQETQSRLKYQIESLLYDLPVDDADITR